MLNNLSDTEQEEAELRYLFGEAISEYLQGYAYVQGPPAFDTLETASLNLSEDVPRQGFQDGGVTGLAPTHLDALGNIIFPYDGPGDDDAGVDAGTNTGAGLVAAAIEAGYAMSNVGLLAAIGKIGYSLITGQPATPNVAPLTISIAAMEDHTETEQGLVDIEAAEAEYGKGTSSVFAGAPASGAQTTGPVGGTVGGSAVSEQSDDTGPAGTPEGLTGSDVTSGYGGHGAGGAMTDTTNIGNVAAGYGVPSAGSGEDAGTAAGSDTGAVGSGAGGVGVGDAWKHGGQIKGYREGDLVEDDQADTQLDGLGLGPLGVINDPDGTTGVADDLDMDLPVGSYVLNEEAVKLTGVVSVNKMIKEAIDLAIEDGVDLPKEIKASEKIPIRISQGEGAIPNPLVDYIGLKKLENMNNRGLKVRKQREAEEAPVEMAAAPSPQEDLLAQIQPVA